MDELYTICWEAHGFFGRGTERMTLEAVYREVDRLNRQYPDMHHWSEAALPDRTVAPEMPEGPPPSLVARIYHAFAVEDARLFALALDDVPLRDMRLLAQRLMRMSTDVRAQIDARLRERKPE